MTNPIRKFFFKRSLLKTLWEEAEHKIVIARYAEGAATDYAKTIEPKAKELEELKAEITKLEASTTREDREKRKPLYPQRDKIEKEVMMMAAFISKYQKEAQELRSQAAQLHHKLAFVRKHY